MFPPIEITFKHRPEGLFPVMDAWRKPFDTASPVMTSLRDVFKSLIQFFGNLIHLPQNEWHLSICQIRMANDIEHVAKAVFQHDSHEPPGPELWSSLAFWKQFHRFCPLRMVR